MREDADTDSLSDMYLDDPTSDLDNTRTLRTVSSVDSFRSAISIIRVKEDTNAKTSPLGTGAVTGIKDESSKSQVPLKESNSMDLLDEVEGMYRILDLVSEQGSGGLGEWRLCPVPIPK